MSDIWYDNFIKILLKRYPKKVQLAQELMDLLCIEREAAYRRLRKDVVFTLHEIVKIASEWNISLDEVTGVSSGQIHFQMRQMNYVSPPEEEVNFLQYVIQSITYLQNFPNTEFMDICNKLPRQLLAHYRYLNQYYLFKWMYQYGNEKEVVPFSQLIISGEKLKVVEDYCKAIRLVPNSNFIFDRMIFEYLISDIQYFRSIRMLTDEDIKFIKQDLNNMLDDLLEIASKGCYPQTQNKVNLYISQLHVDTNYSYTFSPVANICFVHAFEKYEIYTFNTEMANNFKTWMLLKKRTSTQISEVDERSRIEFFTKQRKLINEL